MIKINETFAMTAHFKNIFPTFETFTRKLDKYFSTSFDELTNVEKLYNLLFMEFANSNIGYDTEEAFCRHFFVTLLDETDVFFKKMLLVDELRRMDVEELMDEITSIANTAQNNNTVVNSPLTEIIPYISVQNTSTSRINKSVAISRALSMYRSQGINDFLSNFRKHFVNIHGEEFVYKKIKE